MDIEDVRAQKAELERQITEMLQRFERQTATDIADVEMTRIRLAVPGSNSRIEIRLAVRVRD